MSKKISAKIHAQKIMREQITRDNDGNATINNFFSAEELKQEMTEQKLLEKAQEKIDSLKNLMSEKDIENGNTREAWVAVDFLLKEDQEFAKEFTEEMKREHDLRAEHDHDHENNSFDKEMEEIDASVERERLEQADAFLDQHENQLDAFDKELEAVDASVERERLEQADAHLDHDYEDEHSM